MFPPEIVTNGCPKIMEPTFWWENLASQNFRGCRVYLARPNFQGIGLTNQKKQLKTPGVSAPPSVFGAAIRRCPPKRRTPRFHPKIHQGTTKSNGKSSGTRKTKVPRPTERNTPQQEKIFPNFLPRFLFQLVCVFFCFFGWKVRNMSFVSKRENKNWSCVSQVVFVNWRLMYLQLQIWHHFEY